MTMRFFDVEYAHLLLEEAAFVVCGEAVDGKDALGKACELQPDVIVMDVSMSRLNGLDATAKLGACSPTAKYYLTLDVGPEFSIIRNGRGKRPAHRSIPDWTTQRTN
jgi:DNA-binding NarL/FixJ family response regulator